MNDYLETECVEKIKKECLLQVFDEIDSTNEYLKKLVKREAISLPLPVLVVAERQTAGKGTKGRKWVDSPTSLKFSLLISFAGESKRLALLSPYIALKLRKVLSAAAKKEVKIKWPNDLYCLEGKIAGILTEIIQKAGTLYLIIGVGINLASDPEVNRNINSLAGSLFKRIDPGELKRIRSLILLCASEEIIRTVKNLPEELSAEEIKDWNQSDVYNGQRLRLIEGERIVSEGQNVGIDKKGRILGNSALKWSSLGNMEKPRAYLHDSKSQLSSVLVSDLVKLSFEEAWACSVAQKSLTTQFEELVGRKGGKVHWLRAGDRFEGPLTMINEYDSPSRLGADRWFAALGAASQYYGNSIVLVQFGTATTVDEINFERDRYVFLGGRIAPGIDVMFKSLKERIPALNVSSGDLVDFPRNTEDAVTTGIIECQIGLIKNAVEKLKKKSDHAPVIVVLTGGGIESYEALHRCAVDHLPRAHINTNLVLKGLALEVQNKR